MPVFPVPLAAPALVNQLFLLGPQSLGTVNISRGTAASSVAWPNANRAFFYPFRIGCAVRVTSILLMNGATVSASVDAGIYDQNGTRIVSTGAFTPTTINVNQEWQLTDTTIGPGLYYLALVMNNTTGTVTRMSITGAYAQVLGLAQMDSAYLLPATATLATCASSTVPLPLMGIRATGDLAFGMDDQQEAVPPLVTISPWHFDAVNMQAIGQITSGSTHPLTTLASVAYPSANVGIHVPFTLYRTTLVRKMFVLNGAAVGNNCDVGIYDVRGTRLVSIGTTVMTGTNVVQAFDIADTTLGPGTYFMSISANSITNTNMFAYGMAALPINHFGIRQSATSFPLPPTLSFLNAQVAYLPVFGLSTRSVI